MTQTAVSSTWSRHAREQIPDLSELATQLAGDGWTLSVQGRKVYLVPAALTKEAALAEVVARAGTRWLAAAGDSLLDRGMLAAADIAVRPPHGELHEQGYQLPGMRLSDQPGLMGGEEIVALLRRVVSGAGPADPASAGGQHLAGPGRIFRLAQGEHPRNGH